MTSTIKLLLAAAYASVVLGQSISVKDIGTPTGGGSGSTVCIPNCEISLFGAGDACPDGSYASFGGACSVLNDRGTDQTLKFEAYGGSGCDDFTVQYNDHAFTVYGNGGDFNIRTNILKCYLAAEGGQCAPSSPPNGGCDVQ